MDSGDYRAEPAAEEAPATGATSVLHAEGSALTTETAGGRSATRVALPNGTVVETVSDETAGTTTTTVIHADGSTSVVTTDTATESSRSVVVHADGSVHQVAVEREDLLQSPSKQEL